MATIAHPDRLVLKDSDGDNLTLHTKTSRIPTHVYASDPTSASYVCVTLQPDQLRALREWIDGELAETPAAAPRSNPHGNLVVSDQDDDTARFTLLRSTYWPDYIANVTTDNGNPVGLTTTDVASLRDWAIGLVGNPAADNAGDAHKLEERTEEVRKLQAALARKNEELEQARAEGGSTKRDAIMEYARRVTSVANDMGGNQGPAGAILPDTYVAAAHRLVITQCLRGEA